MPPDSTVGELEQLHRQARTARARLEPSWYLDLAYYIGEQWLAWDGRQLYRPAMPRNRITVVDNRIMGCVRTEIAKMTKNRPVFAVTPRSGDEEDANAAELGEQIMRYLWGHLNLQELTVKGLFWSRICGAGFLKCYWDSSIGEKRDVLLDPSGSVLTGDDGRPMDPTVLPPLPGVSRKTVAQGDVRVETRSPFQMFVDPLADTFEEAEWVIEESIKSQEYVRRRYGKDLQPDTPANPGLIEARMGAVYMPGTGGYKGLKVREYWCRPNSTHPKGRRAVWATSGGSKNPVSTLLEEEGAPFDPMPYVMLTGIPVPGRLWPTSIVEQLRGPQTELNKVKSQLAENRNRVGNPTLVASKQAVQDPDKFAQATTMPGGIYWLDDIGSPNAMPQYLQAPPLPEYVPEEVQRIEEAIQEISGQHEVTSAQVPPGVTAASAINLLQEADNTRLGPAITDYEYQLGKLGQKLLKLVGRYYTDARTIKIGGDNGAWQIFDFRGSMLRDNTQVQVQAGSAFPQSQAAKQAAMQDMMTFLAQSGNALHGRQLAQFVEDWGFGNSLRFMAEYTVDETQANRENVLLAQGQELQLNPYDNDEVHLEKHEEFEKQPRFSQLPKLAQQHHLAHTDLHRERLAQQQAEQMQMQMQMQGQPPPEQQGQQMQMDLSGQAQQQGQQAAQGHQQMQHEAADHAQQAGYGQAQAEQSQRHAEEAHHARLQQQAEQHQQRLHQQEELHRARLAAQAQSQRQTGGQGGRRKNPA